MANQAHPGFKAVQNKIAAKQGISQAAAGAILAKSSRNASESAKEKNPRLRRVGAAKRRLKKLKADSQPKQDKQDKY